MAEFCAFVGVLNAHVVYAGVTIKLILSVRIRKPILSREIQAALRVKR